MSDQQPKSPQLLDRISTLFGGSRQPQVQPLSDKVGTLITSTYDLDTLVNSSLEMFRRELQSSYVKIVLVDREELLFFNSVGHHEQKMYPNDIPRLEALSVHRFANIDDLPEGELKKWMVNFEISLLYKLEVRGNRVGYLFLGKKIGGGSYTRQELEIFMNAVEQLAVAFANALAVRRISAFNEELKQEVEKATEKLARANEELKVLDKLKDEFVSMASHELKSPLNAVKNYLWLAINKGKLEPQKMDEYLQIALKATDQVLFLVNDLLDVSRIESGRLQLTIEPINLLSLVSETGGIYQNLIKEKGLEFAIEIDPQIMVNADSARLREILSNLLSNAIKYSLKGSVKVRASIQESLVTVNVIDTGVGISKEDQAKLFDKFIRLNANYKELASVEGTGLGLYITKKLVELMGGTIGVDSDLGAGSKFWFTVPVAK